VLLFISTCLIHGLVALMAWSGMAGDVTFLSPGTAEEIWKIVGFPAFTLLPKSFVNSNFWGVFTGNSLAWGLMVYAVTGLFRHY
jgi:hypothetical protein